MGGNPNFRGWSFLVGSFANHRASLDAALEGLESNRSLESAIQVAFEVLSLLEEASYPSASRVIDENLVQLPNAERQDGWFMPHPWMRGERSAFELYESEQLPVEAKFFWLQKRSSTLIAGATHFSKNWEDFEFTRTSENKVGVDFFLTPDAESLLVVLSNLGNLRVLELSKRLSNTQVDVLENWVSARNQTDPALLHLALWESFRLQSVNSKFFAGVSEFFQELVIHLSSRGKTDQQAQLFANRLLGRLIFVWFLRKMGLIAEQSEYFECAQMSSSDYYRNVLAGLFFDVLNKPMDERQALGSIVADRSTPYLNGGLFSPREDDWVGDPEVTFPNNFFERLFNHLGDFNFTTDESTPEYEQVAIDPEMLGRVFESLLASQIEETGEQARKAKGAFYTPREIVGYICRESVRSYLCSLRPEDSRLTNAVSKLIDTSDQEWVLAGSNSLRDIPDPLRQEIIARLRKIRTIDPACGSGAFPLGLVHLLCKLQLRLDPRLDELKLKLTVLRDNIYGVDIEPMAVEISRLRSWLSIIVSEQGHKKIEPLPNLEFNFVCANSLIRLQDENLLTDRDLQKRLSDIREKYFSATRPTTKTRLQNEYAESTKPDLFDEFDDRNRQLKSFNPFDTNGQASFFDPEVMFGLGEGFDVVVGNPPYVDSEFMAKRTPALRTHLKESYKTAKGNWDLFIPFVERAIEIVREGGLVSFIVKNSLLGAPYAAALREMAAGLQIEEVRDYGNIKLFESASVDTCVFRLRRTPISAPVKFAQMASPNTVRSDTMVDPSVLKNATSWITFLLPREVREVLEILGRSPNLGSLGFTGGAAATVSEAYLIAEKVVNNSDPAASDKKLINTGTIDPFVTKWGVAETKYLGSSYSHPTVSIVSLEAVNPVRAQQASMPKIVVNGMGNVEAFLDTDGEFLAGKTTSALYRSENPVAPSLEVVAALLNSSVGRFWFKANFLVSGMGGLNAQNLLTLPIPVLDSSQAENLARLTRRFADNEVADWREILDDQVVKLYAMSEKEKVAIRTFLSKAQK